jgi:hypothetical protein
VEASGEGWRIGVKAVGEGGDCVGRQPASGESRWISAGRAVLQRDIERWERVIHRRVENTTGAREGGGYYRGRRRGGRRRYTPGFVVRDGGLLRLPAVPEAEESEPRVLSVNIRWRILHIGP